ncbi:MAG: phage holin family protein [Spirochaetota bacterium]|nr:phage holin family protein [Spirochaetota bacterium]
MIYVIKFITYVVVTAGIFIILSKKVKQVQVKNMSIALGTSFVYSIFNFFLAWLLIFIIKVLAFITGFFFFLVWLISPLIANSILLYYTDKLIEPFKIEGIKWTFFTAGIITISSFAINMLFKIFEKS